MFVYGLSETIPGETYRMSHVTFNPQEPHSRWRNIVLATAVAGTLDIIAAMLLVTSRGGNPVNAIAAVASGIYGREAFSGAVWYVVLGLALHYLIMATFVVVFDGVQGSRKDRFRANLACNALGAGVAIYLVMNLLVIPLSNAPFKPQSGAAEIAILILIHIACVGVPISSIWQVRQ